MGFLLQESIEKELGITVNFYHGGCTQNQRKEMVDSFQQDPESKILILSLKAGGTGLTTRENAALTVLRHRKTSRLGGDG